MGDSSHSRGWHGPKCWIISVLVGLTIGWLLTIVAPPAPYAKGDQGTHAGHNDPAIDHAPADEDAHAPDALVTEPEHDTSTMIVSVDDGTPVPVLPPQNHADGHAPDPDHPVPAQEPAHGENADSHVGEHEHGPAPRISIALCVPFAVLLMSIALMPFINEHFWHQHFPDFAFLLGGIMVAYYLLGFDQPGYSHGLSYGQYQMLHVGMEYYAFIALIGGLFVASGGILIDVKGRGRPVVNTALLAFGAVIANIVGTTGASVLLIRPFMRMNKGRLKPMHVVMFIFIVSNCGGCLTPIGDPPLYLGFLKGVPFQWTLTHLWPEWLACIGILLAVFFVIDVKIGRGDLTDEELACNQPVRVGVKGMSGIVALALIIFGVFIDPLLKSAHVTALEGVPVGATFQIAVAIGAYKLANPAYHEANAFNFFPVKEVGLLFVGIFATMAPALGYLAEHGKGLGLDSPTAFYFATGALSGVLDNAPTYLNFLQVAFAANDLALTPDNVHLFLATDTGVHELAAVSLGAVFFGAMTYIGNGPNFMVKAIAEAGGLKMPSFFGYVARAVVILVPTLVLVWALFIR